QRFAVDNSDLRLRKRHHGRDGSEFFPPVLGHTEFLDALLRHQRVASGEPVGLEFPPLALRLARVTGGPRFVFVHDEPRARAPLELTGKPEVISVQVRGRHGGDLAPGPSLAGEEPLPPGEVFRKVPAGIEQVQPAGKVVDHVRPTQGHRSAGEGARQSHRNRPDTLRDLLHGRLVHHACAPYPADSSGRSSASRSASSGTYPSMWRSSGPLYSESGRMRAFEACCSSTCAVHPVIREATNSGVKVGVSKPMRLYAGPAG